MIAPMKDKGIGKDREFAVILEKIHSDFKIFGEDLSSVKKRLDMLFEELGKQKEDMFVIKTDIRIMKTDIQTLKEDVKIIREDIKTFDRRITHLEEVPK